jgi:hypothetical protein
VEAIEGQVRVCEWFKTACVCACAAMLLWRCSRAGEGNRGSCARNNALKVLVFVRTL